MRANEFILSEKRRRRKKSRGFYGTGWFGYPAVDSNDSGGGDGGGVAETQEDIENNLPSIELARNNIAKILQAAQRIYDDWDESDRDTYAGGGICHLIADAICDVMGEIGIDCTPVSCSYEQHVYVAVRVAEGVYTIDIPYSIYETGGGFSWQKLPDVKFESRDVVFYRTSGDPNEFENYTSLEEATDNILRLRGNAGHGRAQKFIDALYARYPDTFQNNHVMSWGSGDEQEIALFELVPNIARPNAVDIKWIQAYPLRKGIGRRAMEILQSMAQEHGVALTLYPWDKGQISQAKLIKFYRQMGFRPTTKGSKNMIWQGVAEENLSEFAPSPDYRDDDDRQDMPLLEFAKIIYRQIQLLSKLFLGSEYTMVDHKRPDKIIVEFYPKDKTSGRNGAILYSLIGKQNEYPTVNFMLIDFEQGPEIGRSRKAGTAIPKTRTNALKIADIIYNTVGLPAQDRKISENFADGRNPGRRGLAKRMGVPTKASVSRLRQIAKSSSGEKQRMAHWMANMKAGKKK